MQPAALRWGWPFGRSPACIALGGFPPLGVPCSPHVGLGGVALAGAVGCSVVGCGVWPAGCVACGVWPSGFRLRRSCHGPQDARLVFAGCGGLFMPPARPQLFHRRATSPVPVGSFQWASCPARPRSVAARAGGWLGCCGVTPFVKNRAVGGGGEDMPGRLAFVARVHADART